MKRKKTAGVWRLPRETIKETPQGAIDRVPTGKGPSAVYAGRLAHCRMNSRCSWNEPRPHPAHYARTCCALADRINKERPALPGQHAPCRHCARCCHLTAATEAMNRFLFCAFPWRPIAGSGCEVFPVVDGFPARRGRPVLQLSAASVAQIEFNILSSCVAPRHTEGNSGVGAKSKFAPHPSSGCTRTGYRGQRATDSAAKPAGIWTDPAAIHGAAACRQKA